MGKDAELHAAARALGQRVRGRQAVPDAMRDAVDGLAATIRADHVLIRLDPGQSDVPALVSWRDEHLGGPLTALAGCSFSWLGDADRWITEDQASAGSAAPPERERAAWAAAGAGPVLVVALRDGDQRLGALTLIRDDGGPAWTAVEVGLVESIAADLGRAVRLALLDARERDLERRLQELDTVKTDFMSTISHELRTPLTSIAGYVEMLRDEDAGPLDPGQDRMLDVIARNTVRLRTLIEDLLTLSNIEGGALRPSWRTVDLAALLESALAAIAPVAAKASVGVHTDVRGPMLIRADPEQLDRVLGNLLSNAVKFTPPEGTVTVVGRQEAVEVVLVVADTGMGIPHAEQPALFASFFRASNAVRHAIPGTGLGLAIVRTIVDNHGGQIEVSSTEGAGTAVTVRLPGVA